MYHNFVMQIMEDEEEIGICKYCGMEMCCMNGFKQHFIADHYDIIKKQAKKQGITPKEAIQNLQE